jgi:hypothetical protein
MHDTVDGELFWSKVDRSGGPDACWIGTFRCFPNGYARAGRGYAHRVAYEFAVGPIPPGMDLDHVKARGCTHKNCVNPAHLEPVTRRENLLRADTVAARNAAKTHCIHGHPFTPENTYTTGGRRRCKTCHRATMAAYNARARTPGATPRPRP